MKKFILFVFTVCCLFSQEQLSANTVIVKGYVKDSTGNPVANRNVKVFTNDSSQGCIFTHVVSTNPNGFYIDTVTCSGNTDIKNLFVKVENCNGAWIVQNPNVMMASGLVEVNFVICKPVISTPAPCKAVFNYTLTETGVKFSSTSSEIPAGDSIISRTWVFGDSSNALGGNQADPWHEYKKAGSYNVCLTIKTKKGCQSSYCKTVIFQPKPADSCHATVHANVERISIKKFRFTSNTVTVAAGDSIIKRTWTFGDGSSVSGNEVYPIKEYKDTGAYNVCVKIKTARGCEAQHCFTVAVRDTVVRTVSCKAHFTFTYKDSVAYFNSAASSAPAGDSIISRTWMYINGRDTLKLEGNVVDTFVTYLQPGKYTVYLVIKTKKGCENKFAGDVKIPEKPTPVCKAHFSFTYKDSVAYFNSAASSAPAGDSIISRTWMYINGRDTLKLEGNVIDTSIAYYQPGTYTVFLYIKTKKGCENKFVGEVKIPAKPAPANCKANFTFTVQNNTVKFNSQSSTAPTGDSIIGRTWVFGDNTPAVTNLVDPSHVYAKAGEYTVYLYIKTRNGCENKYIGKVETDSAKPAACKLTVQFATNRISGKKVQFNSLQTVSLNNDSIISRTWKFGDGTVLQGNEISPVKEFPTAGTYTTCLQVKTKNGCEASLCKQVTVQDSVNTPESSVNFVKIVSLNPNPVTTRMLATIWSRNTNTEVEITVVDLYGSPKFSFKKVLLEGNNVIEVITANLYRGPYFLKVTSRSAKDSRIFYKL